MKRNTGTGSFKISQSHKNASHFTNIPTNKQKNELLTDNDYLLFNVQNQTSSTSHKKGMAIRHTPMSQQDFY